MGSQKQLFSLPSLSHLAHLASVLFLVLKRKNKRDITTWLSIVFSDDQPETTLQNLITGQRIRVSLLNKAHFQSTPVRWPLCDKSLTTSVKAERCAFPSWQLKNSSLARTTEEIHLGHNTDFQERRQMLQSRDLNALFPPAVGLSASDWGFVLSQWSPLVVV